MHRVVENRFTTLDRAQAGEATPPLDFDYSGRDGFYDQDQLFAVFERHEIEGLIARLGRALVDGYSD
jgi:hypothetical protein